MAASIARISFERPTSGHDKRTSEAYVRSPQATAVIVTTPSPSSVEDRLNQTQPGLTARASVVDYLIAHTAGSRAAKAHLYSTLTAY